MFFIGIDPGQTGAVAVVNDAGRLEIYFDLSNSIASYGYIEECLASFIDAEDVKVAIEDVHALPKQSSVAGFKFGINVGYANMLAYFLDPEYTKVTPMKWKKFFGLIRDKGETKTSFKHKSIDKAKELFPASAKAFKASKDGRAEAALIAYWLYANYKRKENEDDS